MSAYLNYIYSPHFMTPRTATARGKAEQADYAAVCANEDSTEVNII